MATLSETQLRLVYSLLKPAVRAAAHFGIPIRSLVELVRLAYFEQLQRSGRSLPEIATTFGQTLRHMRSLAARLDSDFYASEREVGLGRSVEAEIARTEPASLDAIVASHAAWAQADVVAAVEALVAEGRVRRAADGALSTASRYVLLRSDSFQHRIDAINHYLDGGYRAVLHRLIFNDAATARMKTLSFSARAEDLVRFFDGLEGDLRRNIAELDEQATFSGDADKRFILSIALAPLDDAVEPRRPDP